MDVKTVSHCYANESMNDKSPRMSQARNSAIVLLTSPPLRGYWKSRIGWSAKNGERSLSDHQRRPMNAYPRMIIPAKTRMTLSSRGGLGLSRETRRIRGLGLPPFALMSQRGPQMDSVLSRLSWGGSLPFVPITKKPLLSKTRSKASCHV
ncbi:hypothetical protein BDM02DRAFT_1470332 [Thelephora ganbajun]|uniref:Uncharacterized protein n=1 Tax=Thelephora ganbajun TaxID=370292 RepID=A0ACB6Z2E7_THEGA|nr:hypothetical protein BDM02DRAFT_1470332 [Thelephora ganbajun]